MKTLRKSNLLQNKNLLYLRILSEKLKDEEGGKFYKPAYNLLLLIRYHCRIYSYVVPLLIKKQLKNLHTKKWTPDNV